MSWDATRAYGKLVAAQTMETSIQAILKWFKILDITN